MPAPLINYTHKRAGTKVGAGRIEVCPACGRKGRMTRFTRPAMGCAYWDCTHTADDLGWATCARDRCNGYIVDGVDVPADRPTKEA